MFKKRYADAVISEDVDALVLFEAPVLIRNLEIQQNDQVKFELLSLAGKLVSNKPPHHDRTQHLQYFETR